ncbi:N-acetyltransferase [Mycolicibacterium sp. P1-18]|uniref:GNAT family N-acetyltransferase n=1 Tax=Mycolicibacterium sp. P1-18 TaxID=2024615 RepID=UPI0011F35E18|nr:GNAT family N-acetyltransferase [Mycolicibacterium sp. P1-18]KAA0094126.1 N-acetyltransferase [Mycolicibacterium sp. P1-18]
MRLVITRSSPAAAADADVVRTVTELVNDVYAVAEQGLWIDGAARTTTEEVQSFLEAGQLLVATSAGQVVGCVRVQRLDDETSEFGMLAATPAHRNTGIGRRMVDFAERDSVASGRRTMQLELLQPRDWTHPSKEFLAQWYRRLGYVVVRAGLIEESYPHLAPLLATPCDFVVYQKPLADADGRSDPV